LPIFRLAPWDPTDTVWQDFRFVETVWTNVHNEHAARVLLSPVSAGPKDKQRCRLDPAHEILALDLFRETHRDESHPVVVFTGVIGSVLDARKAREPSIEL
jgi:hypothetical protein